MRVFSICLLTLLLAAPAWAKIEVPIGYLERKEPAAPTLSNLDPVPDDLGLAGARVGLEENETTGRFLGHSYSLREYVIDPQADFLAAAAPILEESRVLLVKAPADELLALADLPQAEGVLLFNISAQDGALRDTQCRGNVLHTITSYAMRSDALAQFLSKKRWTNWALISGPDPRDAAFAGALRGSAKKFGLKLRDEKTWSFEADMRRNAAQDVPVFTQSLKSHDVLLVADEIGDFGRYVLYNTWEPRPVAGSEGVTPQAWSSVVEQWGAAQLQKRFAKSSGRKMRSEDYAAWAAVRSVGEAVTRTGKADASALRTYMLSEAFELQGFKGRPLSYRVWNGQLRQPVPLVHARALVSLAPIEGFLHQHTELDTLGIDKSETACRAFEG